VEERGGRFGFRFLGHVYRPLPAAVQERLFRSAPADVREFCTLILSDDEVICAERRWIDGAALPLLTEELLRGITANEWIARNVTVSMTERVVSACRAGDVEADGLLRCPADTPVLVYDSTLWVGTKPFSRALHSFAPGFQLDSPLG